MRALYVAAVGLCTPVIALNIYANHLFKIYPESSTPGRDTISTTLPRCSLDNFVDHLFSTWMLRIEGRAGKLAGYPHIDGQDYAHGIFQLHSRSPTDDSLTVQWSMPKPILQYGKKIGITIPLGGLQTFSVDKLKDGTTRVYYTAIEDWADAKPNKMDWWHRLYMRIILEQTKRDIIRDIRRGDARKVA